MQSITRRAGTVGQPCQSSASDRLMGRRNDHFHSIATVADLLSVSSRTVRRWIESGALVAHHFGAAVRIAERDLQAFLSRHRGL